MHRLGLFVTPSPRKADILMVVGPVTHHMELALKKAFDAMPTPKRVMAVVELVRYLVEYLAQALSLPLVYQR